MMNNIRFSFCKSVTRLLLKLCLIYSLKLTQNISMTVSINISYKIFENFKTSLTHTQKNTALY